DQAGIADEREHDELSESVPPLPSSPLEELDDNGDREHDNDHARGEAREQRVPRPEARSHDIRDDPACQRHKSDYGEHPPAPGRRLDRLRASRTSVVASHIGRGYVDGSADAGRDLSVMFRDATLRTLTRM